MLRALFLCLTYLLIGLSLCAAPLTYAQSQLSTDIDELQLRLSNTADVDEETKATLEDQLRIAEARLGDARTAQENRQEYLDQVEGVEAKIDNLESDIDALRDTPEQAEPDADTLNKESLRAYQEELSDAESLLAASRNEADRLSADLSRIDQRRDIVQSELNQAKDELNRIDGVLSEPVIDEAELSDFVARVALQARRNYRQAQIKLLETEAATRADRIRLIEAERAKKNEEITQVSKRIEVLQTFTGQQRLNAARDLKRQNLRVLASATAHPLLEQFTQENLEMIERLEALAKDEVNLPRRRADAQASLDSVSENLRIARQLTELGDLDRRAGETLRRLRSSVPVIANLRSAREQARAEIIDAGQEQLLAQEQLGQILDPEAILRDYRRAQPDAPDLSEETTEALNTLNNVRRDILSSIDAAATDRRGDAAKLLATQTELLETSEDLQTMLDQNLLWLPSAEPVLQASWIGKIGRGTIKLLQPARFGQVVLCLQRESLRIWPVVMFIVLLAGGLFSMRARLRADIAETATHVRKVREDNYLATPKVIAESVLIALPLPILVLMSSWLLSRSQAANGFVFDVADALVYLSVFLLFFLTLRAWVSKDGLFHAHLPIPEDLRLGIQAETRWFIPVAGTAITLFVSTMESRDVDIYEGFSLLAFLVTAISLGLLSYRLLWGRRHAFTKTLDPEGVLFRWRKLFIALAVGLPFLAALAAMGGYFSTADELLDRVFSTGWIAVLTFVVFGVLRRTVNIAHRRLSLKQALEKREAAIETRRREREAALAEDDDAMVEPETTPSVDYEQIDLEESSRQTRQLVWTAVLIGFVALLWLVWRDLLPALSALDSVELYKHGTQLQGEGESAIEVADYITLWDLVQALVTIVITVLASRNLPGFLEIFVLNRTSLDRGLRYALVTVMGYIIVGIGIVIAFGQLGLQWQQFAIIGGALALGIGFGLGEIISNFISGLIILFERPLRVGDYVTVGDQSGTVSRINIRATTLTDLDNKEILIPNKEFVTGRVTNWTLSNSILRIIIPVGIAYGSDTRRAQKIMMDVLQSESKVLDKPAPQAIFVNFGDSSLNFELRVFIRSFEDRFPVINAVHTSINLALEEAGISIPFPQRDLHLVSADARLTVSEALKESRKAAPKAPAKPKAKPKKS